MTTTPLDLTALPTDPLAPIGPCEVCHGPANIHYRLVEHRRCWDHAPGLAEAVLRGWVSLDVVGDRDLARIPELQGSL